MKKHYFVKSIALAALSAISVAGIAQQAKLQDNGKPVQTGPVSGADKYNAACDSIKTTYLAGNGNTGIMFNVVAKAPLYLTTFVVSTTGSGVDTARVYYRPGSMIGHDLSSAGWILADSISVRSGGTADTLIQANNKPLNFNMMAGDTVGIYVTYTHSVLNVAYTNGTMLDSGLAQKPSIRVLQGYGKSYPFTSQFNPREFNGFINFCPTVIGINEVVNTKSATLFPNPVSSTATLKISENIDLSNLKLVVTDIIGQVVKVEDHISSHTVLISRDNLTNGMYFYTLTQNNKSIQSGKMIVQ